MAHLPLVNPVVADLLPAEFEYIPDSATQIVDGSNTFAPEIIPNYVDGRTLIRWTWEGPADYSLQPGDTLTVGYRVRIIDGTPPGTYVNTAALVDWVSPGNPDNPAPNTEIYLCSGAEKYVDTLDLDGDGRTDEVSCQAEHTTIVAVALELDSEKWTRGALDCLNTDDYGATTACEDEDFNKLGLTFPGGPMDYKLVLTNTSNVSVTNITLVDIFPHVGDIGVVDLKPRDSEWRPNLQGPVLSTGSSVASPLTIYYSTAPNPCRPELASTACVDDWSTELPDDVTSVKAIKIVFCNEAGDDCLVLPRNETLSFTWPMVAPNETNLVKGHASCLNPADDSFDPTNSPACQIAWNSFGYTVSEYRPSDPSAAEALWPSEPIKVGMRLAPPPTGTLALGDFVWLDVAGIEKDGIQQEIERTDWGVNGVRVELYDNNDTLLGTRFTGDNLDGDAGYYLFSNLITGTYKLRFYLPPGYEATVQGQGDAEMGSDGLHPGEDALLGKYYETDPIALSAASVGPDNADRRWDFGLWKPTDYGDAPDEYPTSSATHGADAARHIILPDFHLGSRVDAETNGVPHDNAWGDDLAGSPDDEDGVAFADYIETAELPVGLLHVGNASANQLTITRTQPLTIPTAYISVWVDLNGDGTWQNDERVIYQTVGPAPAGQAATYQFTRNIPASAATIGRTYMRVRYSTEPNVPPTGTAIDGEVEDYVVQIVAKPVKSVVATSEAHSTDNSLAVGEIVRYRLVTQIPEGLLTNFTVTDHLPDHLRFLDDGTVKVALISNGGITPALDAVNGIANIQIEGSSAVAPHADATLPSSQILGGPFASGTNPVFVLGDLHNGDDDDNAEYVVIEFNALVLNVAANQNGTQRTNYFDVSYGQYKEESNRVTITVREPELAISKSLATSQPLGPGATVTYTLQIEHTGNSALDAFDAVVTDPLPVELTDPTLVSISPSGAATGAINSGVLTLDPFDLELGDSITVIVSGILAADVEAEDIIANIGYLTWTSLPGTGTPDNPTGSNTPGDSGDEDGERDGSNEPAVNDYNDQDGVDLFITGDWGDLPSSYPTLSGDNGARHTLLGVGNPYLGSSVDAEANGQPNDTATGDDINGLDDEDGILFLTPLVPGRNALIQVTAGTPGALSAFIDFDNDGTLDPVTLVSAQGPAPVATGTLGDTLLNSSGIYTLTINVPATATGTMAARFRYTEAQNQGGNSPVGLAHSGEVEDYLLAALGDYVWLDQNYNGVQDGGEPGVNGVVVSLLHEDGSPVLDADGTPIATTTSPHPVTAIDGWYEFPGLPVGTYRVHFAAPTGYLLTLQNVGDDATDSDANQSTGISDAVTLGVAEINPTVDAGLVLPAALGDRVWIDTNGNGIQDGGEVGVPDVTVTLHRLGDPTAVMTTTTNASGYYSFTNLLPDTYYVTFARGTLPPGYVVTTPDAGSDDEADSDGDPTTGQTPPVTLQPNEENWSLDLGIYQPVKLGDRVWIDANGNGIQDDGDIGVPDVTVTLHLSGTADVLATTTTDASGYYSFTNLPPNSYYVTFDLNTLPQGYVVTTPNAGSDDEVDSDGDPITGQTAPVTLQSGDENWSLDLGIYQPAKLGDRVWIDANGNGIQDGDEQGVPDVTVTLHILGDPTAVMTTTTDAAGYYNFINLPPNSYYVTFDLNTLPPNHVVTAPHVGDNDEVDSDGDPSNGQTPPVTLQSGDENWSLDLGIYEPAKLGDRVWIDANGNGIQDDGEIGVPDVTVTLHISGTADVFGTTTTDASGYYSFTNLPPNSYYVTFDLNTLPEGYVATTPHVGDNDEVDSDGDPFTGQTPPVTLQSGDENWSLDLGIYKPAKLGDRVWVDANFNGIQDDPDIGVPDVTVTLHISGTPGVVMTTTTDINGYYSFVGLPPNSYYVTFDLNTLPPNHVVTAPNVGDNDEVDSDGDPTTGETPPVTLQSGDENWSLDLGVYKLSMLGDRVWIDANGNGIQDEGEEGVPDVTVTLHIPGVPTAVMTTTTDATGYYRFIDLPPGDYYVTFDLNTLPEGYVVTTPHVGDNDEVDSDGDPITGQTPPVTLATDEQNLTLDLGLYKPAQLGDRVWVDANVNGIQDDGEEGVPGVIVNLYANDTLVTTTTTGIDGRYLFTGLVPGSYFVEFDLSALPPGYEEYIVTHRDVGGDENDAVDSDADRTTGRTHSVTLASGDENLTLDMGIYLPVVIGDRVWEDLNGNNIQDDGEPGVPNVVVAIYDADTNEPVLDMGSGLPLTATTNSDGLYLFSELPPGNYYVVFDRMTLPAGYGPVLANQGDDDEVDSDADINGRTPATGPLPAGAKDLSLDLGIARYDLALSKRADNRTVMPGSLITYTLLYSNTGSGIVANVFIEEIVPEFTSFVADGSTPGWSCADGATEGTSCQLMLGDLQPNSHGQAIFVLRVADTLPDSPTTIRNEARLGVVDMPDPLLPTTADDNVVVQRPTSEKPTDQPANPNAVKVYLPSILK